MLSEGLQEEFLNFVWLFVRIGDLESVFIIKFEHQWAGGMREISGFGFEEELKLGVDGVEGEVFSHVLKRANKYFNKKFWCLNFEISNYKIESGKFDPIKFTHWISGRKKW